MNGWPAGVMLLLVPTSAALVLPNGSADIHLDWLAAGTTDGHTLNHEIAYSPTPPAIELFVSIIPSAVRWIADDKIASIAAVDINPKIGFPYPGL